MVGDIRLKEIGDYVNSDGFDEALVKYGLTQKRMSEYLRLYRKKFCVAPVSSDKVQTIQDAMLFGNVDSFQDMDIQSVTINTWGSETNPSKQVKVKLVAKELQIDNVNLIDDFKREVKEYKPVNFPSYVRENKGDSHVLFVAFPDVHHALLAWKEESGADYDIKISHERFMSAIQKLVDAGRVHNLSKIVISMNGDILNSEGYTNATTGGTKQSDDSRWQKAFTTCWKMIRDGIDYCKQFADVELIINQGNHDHVVAYYLGEVLTAWYTNDNHVTVDNTPTHYKYKQYGNTLVGITHGDGAKPAQLPLLMASDVPKMWANTKHRYFLIGHYHATSTRGFQTESESVGCTVIVCPALSSASDWTVRSGYRSVPEAQAYLYHETKGRVATYHYRV